MEMNVLRPALSGSLTPAFSAALMIRRGPWPHQRVRLLGLPPAAKTRNNKRARIGSALFGASERYFTLQRKNGPRCRVVIKFDGRFMRFSHTEDDAPPHAPKSKSGSSFSATMAFTSCWLYKWLRVSLIA